MGDSMGRACRASCLNIRAIDYHFDDLFMQYLVIFRPSSWAQDPQTNDKQVRPCIHRETSLIQKVHILHLDYHEWAFLAQIATQRLLR